MSNSFTTLWSQDYCRRLKKAEVKEIRYLFGGPHTSQPSFSYAKVKPGDTIYPISLKSGIIHIMTRVVVKEFITYQDYLQNHLKILSGGEDRITEINKEEAYKKEYGDKNPQLIGITCTSETVINEVPARLRFDLSLPVEIVERLRYRTNTTERGLKNLVNGRLKNFLSLFGIYRLTAQSASDFEDLWFEREPILIPANLKESLPDLHTLHLKQPSERIDFATLPPRDYLKVMRKYGWVLSYKSIAFPPEIQKIFDDAMENIPADLKPFIDLWLRGKSVAKIAVHFRMELNVVRSKFDKADHAIFMELYKAERQLKQWIETSFRDNP